MIQRHLISGYDKNDERLPSGICGTCRVTLMEYSHGNFKRDIHLFDHSKVNFSYQTRSKSQQKCECLICKRARCTIGPIVGGKTKQAPGRPQKNPSNEKKKPVKLCNLCLSIIGPGKPHNCSTKNLYSNFKELAGPSERAEQLASAVIVNKSEGERDIHLPRYGGGHPLKITISPDTSSTGRKNQVLSNDDMNDIRLSLSLSDRETLKLSTHVRSAASTKLAVEGNLKQTLYQMNHQIDDLFQVTNIDFVKIEKNEIVEKTPRWSVVCRDVDELIRRTKERRQFGDEEILIKVGIDGGGGFLKICLSIFEFEPNSQPAKHACFKNSGVKKLLIVGLAPSVQENYTNLRKLWIILGLHKLQHKYTIATDLKLCNILLGIMAHGSSHPCCWCDASKNYLQYIGERRTLKSLETNFWNFFDDGREKKKAKQFDNVIHPSIVNHENKMTPVLNLVPPPELHLLVGKMNALYKGLNNEWSDSALVESLPRRTRISSWRKFYWEHMQDSALKN